MSRGNRGAKSTKKSTFRANMVTLGTKTAGIVFGIPHLAIALVNREIAKTEGMVVSLITWDNKIDRVADLRGMRTNTQIEKMEDFVDDTMEKAQQAFVDTMNRIKNKNSQTV